MGQGRSWNLIQDHLGWEKISENSRPALSDPVNSAQVTPFSSDLSSSLPLLPALQEPGKQHQVNG